MRSRTTLGARQPHAAARSAALILIVCAAAVSGLTLVQLGDGGLLVGVASWAVVAVVAAGALACYRMQPERLDGWGALVGAPILGVALICGLNVLTHDASAAAQAFLALPVLWASSHLRHTAVVLVTGAALIGDAVSVFSVEAFQPAATDLIFFGTVLVVMAVTLLRAGTRQERLVAALQEQAAVDSLTGLVNRRIFDRALETSLIRPTPAGMALVLIDVDAFKSINDVHGHPVGDDVLVHLGTVLSEQVRADDAVVSRLGGDELAVLLPGCSAEVAGVRAEALLEAVRTTPLPLDGGSTLHLSISVGVAHLPEHAHDLRGLYSAADAALYEAKRSGRGRVAVASTHAPGVRRPAETVG